jgi:hypothetical protein
MGLFDFGHKQRLHTQLVGNTTGREMFKVSEYNNVKKSLFGIGFFIFCFFTLFYFCWNNISTKVLIFLIIIFLGLCYWFYHNFKELNRLKGLLY